MEIRTQPVQLQRVQLITTEILEIITTIITISIQEIIREQQELLHATIAKTRAIRAQITQVVLIQVLIQAQTRVQIQVQVLIRATPIRQIRRVVVDSCCM